MLLDPIALGPDIDAHLQRVTHRPGQWQVHVAAAHAVGGAGYAVVDANRERGAPAAAVHRAQHRLHLADEIGPSFAIDGARGSDRELEVAREIARGHRAEFPLLRMMPVVSLELARVRIDDGGIVGDEGPSRQHGRAREQEAAGQ